MRTPTPSWRLAAILAVFGATPLLAGDPPQEKPDSPLRGPAVPEARPSDDTLVRRKFDGKVERLEQPAEIAAVDKLVLDKDVRAKLDEIVHKRARLIDEFVADNLPLLTEFQSAAAAKNKGDLFKLLGDASRKLDGLWKDGPLEQQVRALLPADAKAKFETLLQGYWDAVVAERRADPTDVDDNGKQKNRLGIMIEERLKSFGKEIEKSFYRVIDSGDLIYGYLFKGMTLAGDQPAQLREICAEFSRVTKLAPTKEQGEKFFRDISKVLDAEQRKEAIARFVKVMKGKTK